MVFLVGLGHPRVLQGDSVRPRDSRLCPQITFVMCSLLASPALASHHRPVRAFRGRGCCQLHQHPADEAEVSAWAGTGCLGSCWGSPATSGGCGEQCPGFAGYFLPDPASIPYPGGLF